MLEPDISSVEKFSKKLVAEAVGFDTSNTLLKSMTLKSFVSYRILSNAFEWLPA